MTTTLTLLRASVKATSSSLNNLFSRYNSTGTNLDKQKLRKLLTLPTALHEALIGMLLGDAGCYRTSKSLTSNSRIEFSFGKDRLVFAKFIAELLKDFISTPLNTLLVAAVPGGDKVHTSFRLKTIALPVFNYYRDLFYVLNPDTGQYVKIIPLNIVELLSPIGLAHLVMGDGNYQPEARTIRIYLNGFTKAEVERLAAALWSKFGITAGVRHDRKNQYILAIGAKELTKFQELVRGHMHHSMLYRIGL